MNNNDNNNDTFLNRERENIVNATIEANNNINEQEAKTVNNQIKIKKHNPFIRGFIIIFLIFFALTIAFGSYYFIYNFINYEKDPVKEDEAPPVVNPIVNYIESTDKVRKFAIDKEYVLNNKTYNKIVLMLSPNGYDLYKNNDYYLILFINDDDIFYDYGTYIKSDNKIILSSYNNIQNKIGYFDIKEKGLYNESIEGYLSITDSEMKYYTYKSDNEAKILMINASIYGNIAMYISSDKISNSVIVDTSLESASEITIGDNLIFKKENFNIYIDNYTMNLAS